MVSSSLQILECVVVALQHGLVCLEKSAKVNGARANSSLYQTMGKHQYT
jgi:hypothetical protein